MCGRTCCTLPPDVIPQACTVVTGSTMPIWRDSPCGGTYEPSTNVPPTAYTPILFKDDSAGKGKSVQNIVHIHLSIISSLRLITDLRTNFVSILKSADLSIHFYWLSQLRQENDSKFNLIQRPSFIRLSALHTWFLLEVLKPLHNKTKFYLICNPWCGDSFLRK